MPVIPAKLQKPCLIRLACAALLLLVGGVRLPANPPDDLKISGVPDLPPDLLSSIDKYFAPRSNYFMDWDPTAHRMLVASTDDSRQQLHVLLAPQGESRLPSLFPGSIGSGAFMPKLGDLIIFSADHDGNEYDQLYSLDTRNAQTRLLTEGQSSNNGIILGHSGLQIAFFSTMIDDQYADIFVMDPRVAHSDRLVLPIDKPGWDLQDWAHDDCHILVSHGISLYTGYLWQIDAASGETRLLTQQRDNQRLYIEARYTPKDDAVWTLELNDQGNRFISWLPLRADALEPKIPETDDDVLIFELSPDASRLAYLTKSGDESVLHIFNTVTGAEEPVTGIPSGLIGHVRWNADGTELGFCLGGIESPVQACSYTLATHQMTTWTSSGEAEPAIKAPRPEPISLHSFDDLPVTGYIFRPDPAKWPGRRPVLIDIHGGPAMRYVPSYSPLVNYYVNELGVALVFPNVRGSSGSGFEFEQLDNGYKREDSVKDIGAFLDWIDADARLDATRVGVKGGSYGGYMTLAALYHYSNRLRCGSDMVGITDFVTFLKNTEEHRRANRRYEYGDERYPAMNHFLQSISPLNHVAEIGDPVMISAGKNDPRVPESESDQMVAALRAQNNIVWYVLGENEGHGFHEGSDERYQAAAEALFFQTYLLPIHRLTPLLPEATAVQPAPDAKPVQTAGFD